MTVAAGRCSVLEGAGVAGRRSGEQQKLKSERPYQLRPGWLEAAKLPDRPNGLELSWERVGMENFRALS